MTTDVRLRSGGKESSEDTEKLLGEPSTEAGKKEFGERNTKILSSILICFLVVLFMGSLSNKGGARNFLKMADEKKLSVATWNIAAINNNPFEYWITYKENPNYEKLMVEVEHFLEDPGDQDVPVPEVFTPAMFEALDKRLTSTAGWSSVKEYWENDFSKRNIIKTFMKDPLLGSKRLASMPDRVTNTINTADGKTVFRPTVINMFEDDLSSQEAWWKKWETFMFDTKLKIKDKTGAVSSQAPYEMLQKIKKKKYPEITEQEEADSLPLQTMCGAIFDAILVHMMNTVSKPDIWQPLKRTMVENLNKKKVPHTLGILESQYKSFDVILLQEVSSAFIDKARAGPLGKAFYIVAPKDLDTVRDQNSVICLNKAKFESKTNEITDSVNAAFPKGIDVPVAKGDILAITAKAKSGQKFVVASFHGDTNGLATIPVTDAIIKATDSKYKDHKFLFGLDANTYEHAKPGKQQDVLEYASSFKAHGLTSCWGNVINPSNYTTYNARTYLQPQLNKACRRDEKREKGDVNPKDFILFRSTDFGVVETWKDNTGERKYMEDTAFPTLQFPSDHGILASIIEMK